MEESIQFAKKYLEDLLSFFGLNVDVYATTEDNEVIELNVPSTHMNGFLIGNNGDTMRSMQYVTSMALKSAGQEVTRVNVDIAEYKKQRAGRLEERAQIWIEDVKKSGEDKHLEPMNPADRRTIHKLAGDQDVKTESEGEGRDRHIVLKAGAAPETEPEAQE
jgi:spoIIIJ-associated protein